MRKTNNLDKWKGYLQGCLDKFPAEVKLLIDTNNSKDQILSSLKQFSSAEEDYKYLKNVIDLQRNQTSDYLKYFEQISSLEKKYKDVPKSFYSATKGNSYLSLVLRMFMGIEVRNKNLVNKTLSELIKIPPFYLVLDIENKVKFEDRKKLADIYLEYLKKLWDFNCDENLKKMFLQRQLNIADERLQKVVDDFFADFFVDEVIFNKNNYKYTISYPTYWLPSIDSEFERVQFAQRYFSSPARLKIRNSEFGILKYYFPSNEKFRKKLALDIKNDFSNFQNYEIEALLNAIENQSFKKYLSRYKKEFQKPTFSIKKNIYLSGIMSNKFGYYGFFELMKLGYEDMLFLWWLL